MSIKTCPIISKGSHVLSIKFIKNVPCEVGIRGVTKKKKMNKKSIIILNVLNFHVARLYLGMVEFTQQKNLVLTSPKSCMVS